MESEPLSTATDVIDALGGTAEAARKLGRSMQNISNWRRLGIPSEMFLVVTHELAAAKKTADPSVFNNMATPSERESAI